MVINLEKKKVKIARKSDLDFAKVSYPKLFSEIMKDVEKGKIVIDLNL